VKSIKTVFLVLLHCPCFTTLEKYTQNTGHVHLDFNLDGEVAVKVTPNTWTKLTKCCCGLACCFIWLKQL